MAVKWQLHKWGNVLPSVCLFIYRSVCLLATSRKLLIGSSREYFTRDVSRTRKNWLNFGSHLLLYPGTEAFLKDSTTMRDRAFSHGSHLWKRNWWDLHENYSTDVTVDMEVFTKFLEVTRIRSQDSPWRRSAVSKCSYRYLFTYSDFDTKERLWNTY